MKSNRVYATLAPALLVLGIGAGQALAQDGAARPEASPGQSTLVGAALTDGQILQIVRTLNDGEIKQAEEAEDEAESTEVKQFAEMIILDHEHANERLDDLLKGDLSLDDSDMNDMLADKSEQTHELLQDLSGAQYDCAYLRAQVTQHDEAIDLVSKRLQVDAQDPAVKQFVLTLGPSLEHHRETAEAALTKVSCSE